MKHLQWLIRAALFRGGWGCGAYGRMRIKDSYDAFIGSTNELLSYGCSSAYDHVDGEAP